MIAFVRRFLRLVGYKLLGWRRNKSARIILRKVELVCRVNGSFLNISMYVSENGENEQNYSGNEKRRLLKLSKAAQGRGAPDRRMNVVGDALMKIFSSNLRNFVSGRMAANYKERLSTCPTTTYQARSDQSRACLRKCLTSNITESPIYIEFRKRF